MTKATNGRLIFNGDEISVNEIGNKELRDRHTVTIEKSEDTAFHRMRVVSQTPIDKLLLEKKIDVDQHHVGIRYTKIVFKSGANVSSPSFEFRDNKNNFMPPSPPMRVMILSGVQKYLRKETSPEIESLLFNVVAREKTPRENEVTPLRFALDALNNYWYPTRKTSQVLSLQKILLKSLG